MKLLYLGNSITFHEIAPEFGWYGEWGWLQPTGKKIMFIP